jgi:hypothetical protein
MTQDFNNLGSPQDLGYFHPAPRRPTAVTVLAIIGIIFGSMGVLCGPVSLTPYLFDLGVSEPSIDKVKQSPALMAFMIGSTGVWWLLGALELASSIGSLLLRPWARRGLILYAWLAIATGVLGMALMLAWFIPTAYGSLSEPAAMGGVIGGLVGGLIGFIFPILVLVFFRRADVVAAFEGDAATAVHPLLPACSRL